MRQVLTRSYNQETNQTLPDAEVWSVSSGALTSDEIGVPAPAGGNETWPPRPWSAIVHGTVDYIAAGAAPAPGTERQWVLTEQRTPYVERFHGQDFVCVAGETTQVADLSAV